MNKKDRNILGSMIGITLSVLVAWIVWIVRYGISQPPSGTLVGCSFLAGISVIGLLLYNNKHMWKWQEVRRATSDASHNMLKFFGVSLGVLLLITGGTSFLGGVIGGIIYLFTSEKHDILKSIQYGGWVGVVLGLFVAKYVIFDDYTDAD